MTQYNPVSVEFDRDIAWITIDNPPVNATSTAVRAGLKNALTQIKDARVAVLHCAGKTFVAGGDMSEFDAPPALPHLPDVIQEIEDSPTPIIALMHGSILGGGFEIAMACAWRLADGRAVFGLPEVNIGLVPGAGGTQRLPRLIGMEAALDIASTGRPVSAQQLLKLGGLDRVIDGDLKTAAHEFAAALPPHPTPVSKRKVKDFNISLISEKRREALARSKGQESPVHNIDAMEWATLPFEEGQPKERALHMKLRATSQSHALRYAFFAERAASKPNVIAGASPRTLNNVAIVGGGLMGAGITTAMLNSGLMVTLIEQDKQSGDAAQDRVQGLLTGALKRGKITAETLENRLSKLSTTYDYTDATGADLAIEAVFEDVAVKGEVFERLANVVAKDAILATNTSYLDPQDIFKGIPNPERCLGLHFFSPAHIMKLLEIVKTPATSADVLATAFALGKRLHKVSVLSGICDGFIGNRMLSAYRREADQLLAEGALPFEVDAAMRGFGMPMGPYELQDLTGLQIAWANRKRQRADRGEPERPVEIADQLCELGRLGQRSGLGWYSYEAGNRHPKRDETVENLILEYSTTHGIKRQNFSTDQISERLIRTLVNEGARIVDEGIAERVSDVDMVQINGYGFPRWRGGPMHYAETMGWDTTVMV